MNNLSKPSPELKAFCCFFRKEITTNLDWYVRHLGQFGNDPSALAPSIVYALSRRKGVSPLAPDDLITASKNLAKLIQRRKESK